MMPPGRTRKKRNRRSFSSVPTSTASKASTTSSSSVSSSVDTSYSLTTLRSKKNKKDASRQQKRQHQEEEEGEEDTHPEGMVTAKVDTVGRIISRIPSDGKKSPESGTYKWCSRVYTLLIFVPYVFFEWQKCKLKKFHIFLMNPLQHYNSSEACAPIYEALCIHVSGRGSTRFVLRSPR